MELRTKEDCKRLLKVTQDEYSRIITSLQQILVELDSIKSEVKPEVKSNA